jgi:hypothetical protein
MAPNSKNRKSSDFDPGLWSEENPGQSSEQIVMKEPFDYWLQIECPGCGSARTFAHEDEGGQINMVMCNGCSRIYSRRSEEGGGGWTDYGIIPPSISEVIEKVERDGISPNAYSNKTQNKHLDKLASSFINVVEVDDRTTEFGAVYGRRPLIYLPEIATLYVGQEGFHHQDVINGMPRLTADGTPIEDADHAIAEGELHDMGNNEAVFHVGGFGGVRGYEPSLQEVEALRMALSDFTGMDVDTHVGWRARAGSTKGAGIRQAEHDYPWDFDWKMAWQCRMPYVVEKFGGRWWLGEQGWGHDDLARTTGLPLDNFEAYHQGEVVFMPDGSEHQFHEPSRHELSPETREAIEAEAVAKFQPPATTAKVKTSMAMYPADWDKFVQRHPYLTHYTEDRNLAGILRHGILPADDPRADFSEYEGDWFSTRPGHVYLNTGDRDTSMFDTYRQFPLIPVQVDTSKLNPANIVSDEDAIGAWSDHDDEQLGMTHPSMPWAMSELKRRRDGDSPEAPEFDSLGQWAEDNANVLDDPKVVPQAIGMTDTLAHKGPIPPEAVSIHPDYVDSYPDQAIGEAYPPEPLPGQEQLWDVGGPVRTQFDPSIEDRRNQLRSQANTIFTCPKCGSINGLESEGVDYCIDCQAAYSSDGKTPLTPEEVDDIALLKAELDAGPPRPTSARKAAQDDHPELWQHELDQSPRRVRSPTKGRPFDMARGVIDSWRQRRQDNQTGIPNDLTSIVIPCPQCGSKETSPQQVGQVQFCTDCEYAWDVNTQEPVELTPQQIEYQRWYKGQSQKMAMPLSPDSPGLPEFFYHVSPQENRDKILQEGLLPNAPSAWKEIRDVYESEGVPKTPDGVYLYDHLGNARAYASKMSGNGLPFGMKPMSETGWDIYEIPASEARGALIDPEMAQQQGWNYNYDMAMDIVKGQWDHLGPEMPVVQGHRYYTENAIPPEALRIVESMPLVGPEEHEQYKREMQYVPTTLTMVPDLTDSPLADPEWNWNKHGSSYDKDGFKIEKVGANKGVWAYTKPQPEVKGRNTNPKLDSKASSEFDPAIWGEEQRQNPYQYYMIDCPRCGRVHEDYDWKMNQSYNEEVGDYYRCPSCTAFITWHELMDHRKGDPHTAANQFDPTVWGVDIPPDRNQMSIAGTCPDCGGNVEIEREERGHSDYIAGIPYDYYNLTCIGGDDPENPGWENDGCGWSAYSGEKGGAQDAQIQNMIDTNGHPPIDYDWAMEELVTEDGGRYGDSKSFDSDDADTLFNIAQSRGEVDQLTAAFWRWVENVADPEILELEELNWEYLRPDPYDEDNAAFFDEDGMLTDEWYDSTEYRWLWDDLFRNHAPSEALKYMRKLLEPETQA